jgi:hypothetical protein
MLIEERLDRIEKTLQEILNIIKENSTPIDFSGRRFLGLENVFDITDDINPMIRQGDIYTVKENNSVDLHFGNRHVTLQTPELIYKYNDKIHWL